MKSFDILVDGRLIQSDLIVVNLPVRNDIAAYYWLNIGSELINHIIAEKAVSPVDNAGGIALDANADSVVAKYEIVDAYPIVLDASAEFKVLYPLDPEHGVIEIQQELQEVSQKIERVSLPISIGANDMLAIMPLKTIGYVENAIEFDVNASEIKNAIIDGKNSYGGVMVDSSLADPFAVYYEKANSEMALGADVQSLSYLLHMRLIQSNISVGVDSIDFDLYRSLGKPSARIAVGADASFVVEFFTDAGSEMELSSSAAAFPCKLLMPESGIELACAGSAVLRRMRTLADIDAFGTLADIDGMLLEDMYYMDIEE